MDGSQLLNVTVRCKTSSVTRVNFK